MIIVLQKELIRFEVEGVRVIQLLEPYQGPSFTETEDNRE